MKRSDGKTALTTGAARGIDRAPSIVTPRTATKNVDGGNGMSR